MHGPHLAPGARCRPSPASGCRWSSGPGRACSSLRSASAPSAATLHVVAGLRELLLVEQPNGFFVVHDQNPFHACASPTGRDAARRRATPIGRRPELPGRSPVLVERLTGKPEAKRHPVAGMIVHLHTPAVCARAMRRTSVRPRPVPTSLVVKNGLKTSSTISVGNAAPGIADAEASPTPWRRAEWPCGRAMRRTPRAPRARDHRRQLGPPARRPAGPASCARPAWPASAPPRWASPPSALATRFRMACFICRPIQAENRETARPAPSGPRCAAARSARQKGPDSPGPARAGRSRTG